MKILINKKLLLLCLIFISFMVKSQDISKVKIDLNFENTEVKDILSKITKLTDYTFIYKSADFDRSKKLTIDVTDKPLDEILIKIISGQGVRYSVKDNTITFVGLNILKPKFSLTGTIIDETGLGLPGVNVVVKGTILGTLTDIDGKFEMNISSNNIGKYLTFSSIGFDEIKYEIKGEQNFKITLEESSVDIDEIVVVAFGTQKRESMMSSIETVRPSELKVPSSNLTTSLAGRVAGLMSYQRSGEPGEDNAQFFIRGATTFGYSVSPLYLIDGIEMTASDLARLSPDDIESFSVMKDAVATSLYGARGANGVIYVVTKKGKEGPAKISVRMETSLSTSTQDVEYADAVTYMEMRNEASKTRDMNSTRIYSLEKINDTKLGRNRDLYPVTDWKKELIKDFTINKRINFNISGGGSIVNYYVAAGITQDNGLFKVPKVNDFNSNIDLKKYSLRSNINIKIFDKSTLSIKFNVALDDYNGPRASGKKMYTNIMQSNPVMFKPFYEKDEKHRFTNHILFGNNKYDENNFYFNPYAELVSGYKESSKTNVNARIELSHDFEDILKGLKGKIILNSTRYSESGILRQFNPFYYNLIKDTDSNKNELKALNLEKGREYLDYAEIGKKVTTNSYFESRLTYSNTFNEKHDVSSTAVFYMRSESLSNPGTLQKSLPYRNIGLSGRLAYGYDSKYFTEATFGFNGSERFSEDKRFGFFPAIGMGWNISKERFFKPLKKIVTNLKLKATFGVVGQDKIGDSKDRFYYLSEVDMNKGPWSYRFGEDFSEYNRQISVLRYANESITWEKSYKSDIGFELKLFKNLQIKADYYREVRTDILINRIIPASYGLESKIRSNLGEAESSGYDLSFEYNKSFYNGFFISARGNITITESEMTKNEEPDYDYLKSPWKSAIGFPIKQPRGYIAERLFIDEDEVRNSPKQFGNYGAGDIKYRDVNKDGKITSLDQVPIGYPENAKIQYGFGITLGNEMFDFSVYFQGSAQETFFIDPEKVAPFIAVKEKNKPIIRENNLLKAWADDYWSKDNRNPYAKWPRLSDNLVDNNKVRSTWNMHDGSYIRLKSVEIGYNFPKSFAAKLLTKSLRIYLSGSNLLTFSKFKLWDPEMGDKGLGYPIQQVYNIGLLVKF